MKTVTTAAAATLPIKKAADKKNVTPIIKQLNSKKPTDVPVKKIVDTAPVLKTEVVKPGATQKTVEKKVAKAKLKIVPMKSLEELKDFKVDAPASVVNSQIADRVDAFDEEYAKLEAMAAADAVIDAALTAPTDKIEKLEKKEVKLVTKAKSTRSKIEKLTQNIVLPVYDDSAMEFNKEDFFRIKRIVEALATKPNLLQFLSENM